MVDTTSRAEEKEEPPAADTEKKPAEEEKPAAETKEEKSEAKEEKPEAKPEQSEAKPEQSEAKDEQSEAKPEQSEAKPEQAEVKPEKSEAKPEKSEVKGEKSEVNNFDKTIATDRDVIISEDGGSKHKGNLLLLDLIRLHYLLLTCEDKEASKEEKEIDELATKLTQLMLKGKHFELAGLKDVPKPFLTGQGRFLEVKDSIGTEVSEEDAKAFVVKTILSEFKTFAEDSSSIVSQASVATVKEDVKGLLNEKQNPEEEDASHSAPRPCDVLFLPMDYPVEENMPYEHQSGNKHLLFLASQHVASDTDASPERLEAAIKLVTCKVEINSGSELIQKTPRYVVQQLVDNQNSWKEMDKVELVEFAVIFVFEVYLEKQIHGGAPIASSSATSASKEDQNTPSDKPVESSTPHDVLFGRGGMTNGHAGNRRFRDIIALHRPDYIRATKMDKPNVARRIVRAIRQGTPPGRFMKKGEDGKWYDVGDRCAAEKTSQGLRERSNAEKRQRTALREALRIRKEDLEETGESASKKARITDPSGMGQLGIAPAYVAVSGSMNYAGAIPLSLSMKEKPKEPKPKRQKKEKGDASAASEEGGNLETLPPCAVDTDGSILVTDYDILCGRGGLTNHHKGNKRFRDIVALHRPDYVRAPKIQKPSVARVIVRAIRNGDPPGRFLRKDDKTGLWVDIGDKRAAEKTSQALREKTIDEKDGQSPTAPFTSPTVFLPSPDKAPTTTVVDTTGKAEKTGDVDDEKKKEVRESQDDGKAGDGKIQEEAADSSKNGDEKKTEDEKKFVEEAEKTVEV